MLSSSCARILRPAVALVVALALAGAAGGSPSRGRIVFEELASAGDQVQLLRERPDGSGRVRLTHGPGSHFQARWSPDGRAIVAGGAPGLVVISGDGRVLRRIRVSGSTWEPRWSPDGARIAYLILRCDEAHVDPYCADLWVVRANGSGRRRLSASGVDASQGLGSLYSWSPDGRRIAYVNQRGIAIVDVSSGRSRLLTRPTHLIEQFPGWSPDGRSILFTSQRRAFGGSDLVTVAPDGSGLRHLTRAGSPFEPRWSPDGRRIAWLSNLQNGDRWAVFVARADVLTSHEGRHRGGRSGARVVAGLGALALRPRDRLARDRAGGRPRNAGADPRRGRSGLGSLASV